MEVKRQYDEYLTREACMAEAGDRRSATHERILEAAGRLFRQHGVDGVGVDAVMKEAGLTHGGFYLHFPSKEVLAAEVAQSLLEKAAKRWDQISHDQPRQEALEQIVTNYLDAERIAAGRCCVLTTLGPDVARRDASKGAVHGALNGMIAALARCLPGRRRERALAKLSTMVGAVVLARLADDPKLAGAILDAAREDVLGRRSPAPVTPSPDGPAVKAA
jgi:TetR/AcrR family transcriptional regulator, transcriptional repressor for nem operon